MNVMGNEILGVSNMVVCDLCKRNKAIRKITYPTIVPMEDVTQYRGIDYSRTVNGCKIKEMIYNKVNKSEGRMKNEKTK